MEQKDEALVIAERKALELELQLWTERDQAVKVRAGAIQTEMQLLNIQSHECAKNVERLRGLLKPPAAASSDSPNPDPEGGGGGPSAPPPPPPPNGN